MIRSLAIAAAVATLAGVAHAEVIASTADSFTLEKTIGMDVAAGDAFQSVAAVGSWWEDAHTYSGLASNMTLELTPGGCFCESLPGGGVEHGRVIVAWPQRMVRLDAALGPLQEMGATGVLTFAWTPTPGEPFGQKLTMTYVVNGPGVGAIDPLVDQVLATQFAGWVAYLQGED